MDCPKRITEIRQALKKQGEPGTLYQIAGLLSVSNSTTLRWAQGETKPRSRQAEGLNLLHRIVIQAKEGNKGASHILKTLLEPRDKGLLILGLRGVAIAAGLGWLFEKREQS